MIDFEQGASDIRERFGSFLAAGFPGFYPPVSSSRFHVRRSARGRKSVFITAFILGLFIAARADLAMEQEFSDASATNHVVFKVHDHKMRMDQHDQDGYEFSVIVDLNTRDAITLFPRGKTFLKRSGAELRQPTNSDSPTGANEMDQPPARAVDTGTVAKADGYDAELYSWSGANGLKETLWVAKEFPRYDAIRTELAKIDRFNASGSHRNAQPELAPLPGMVIKTEKTANGRKAIVTLVSAKVEPVEASLFELPADYSPWQPPVVQVTNAVTAPLR